MIRSVAVRRCYARNFPLVVVEIEFASVENIHIGFPQRRDCTDVFPVSVKLISVHSLVVRKHLGNDVLAKVVFTIFVVLVVDEVLTKFSHVKI